MAAQQYRERLKKHIEEYRARGQTQTQTLRERIEKLRRGRGSVSGQGFISKVREKGLVEAIREHRTASRGQVKPLGLKHYGKESAIEAEKMYGKGHAIETQRIRYDASGHPYIVDERGMYARSLSHYEVNTSGFGRGGSKLYSRNAAVTLE